MCSYSCASTALSCAGSSLLSNAAGSNTTGSKTRATEGSMCASVTRASGGEPGAGRAARINVSAVRQPANQRDATNAAPASHSTKRMIAVVENPGTARSSVAGETTGDAAASVYPIVSTKKAGWDSTGVGSPAAAPTV